MATSALAPPTAYRGFVDDTITFNGGTVLDVLEHVPDLLWPDSVSVYARMRREPALAAVLRAYTLPLRRASWTVDPAGCRPEVAQLVADDLGLPVAGRDEPTAARVHGVSWSEHLRTALLHLVWGHYGHELLAKVDDAGRARLIALSDRPPWTIQELHVDDQGELLGISQIPVVGKSARPQVNADRLAWYVHEREGAVWTGNSLLRAAFPAWLVKVEMLRVAASSNRRWGMGVPTVRALPGTNPTEAQMQAAALVAQQMRGGETAGAAVPPGFVVELLGLSGSVPDTLSLIKYLDGQMSRMALAGFLDLGQTETGSRALGSSFIDLFTLSLQSCADHLADAVTRQIAARIVGWNWGTGEPIPRVAVSDVGSRHEVTAESLASLLGSGALAADPALEAWVRRTYRLPDSAGPAAGGKVSASRRRGTRRPTRVVAAAGDAEQPDTAQEDQDDHDAAVAALLAALAVLAAPIVAALVAAVVAGLAAGGGAALTRLALGADGDAAVDALAARIGDELVAVAGQAAERAVTEAAAFGVDPAADVDGDSLRGLAQAAAHLIADGLAQSASRTALLHAGDAVDPATVEAAVQAALDDQIAAPTGWVSQTVASAVTAAQHGGRMGVLDQLDADLGDAVTWTASEVNDRNRCVPCAKIDGETFDSYGAAKAAYPTGRYVDCLGRERCRGRVVPTVA